MLLTCSAADLNAIRHRSVWNRRSSRWQWYSDVIPLSAFYITWKSADWAAWVIYLNSRLIYHVDKYACMKICGHFLINDLKMCFYISIDNLIIRILGRYALSSCLFDCYILHCIFFRLSRFCP